MRPDLFVDIGAIYIVQGLMSAPVTYSLTSLLTYLFSSSLIYFLKNRPVSFSRRRS